LKINKTGKPVFKDIGLRYATPSIETKDRQEDVLLGLNKSQGTGFYKDDKTGKLFREEVARMPIMDGIHEQAFSSHKLSVTKN